MKDRLYSSTKGTIVRSVKLFSVIIAIMASICSTAAFSEIELVVVTGKKWVDPSATLCDAGGNCVYDNRVPGPPIDPNGMGTKLPDVNKITGELLATCVGKGESCVDYGQRVIAACIARTAGLVVNCGLVGHNAANGCEAGTAPACPM